MKNSEIKYIAFYDIPDKKNENRNSSPAAVTKINYICSVLNRIGYNIKIISPSWTNNTSGLYKGIKTSLTEKTTLKTFYTFGAKNKIQRILKYFFSLFQLFIFLVFNTKKDEKIIVYHSVMLSFTLRLAKKIKRYRIILEVEEIYQDFQDFSCLTKMNEYKLLDSADSFIFSTELLNKNLNKRNEPFCIINGTYQIEKDFHSSFADNKIHIVYAGTFDPRKGGIIAIDTAKYLTNRYHIHIIGFGSDAERRNIIEKIQMVSEESEATVTYDGLLLGEEYINFIQKCHIGLSPQAPDASFNSTSFPSKILSYMANGLRVVTIRIEAIEKSKVGRYLYYYEKSNPEEIAKTIMKINLNDGYDSRKIIRRLDENFLKELGDLLKDNAL